MIRKIVIVDYGMGNIKSVQRGLEQVGVTAILSADPKVIATASHLVLPGVGAFEDGMKGLEEAGLITAILDFVKTGNPLLGICLGMQMLLDQSEENGRHQGLGLIPGCVKAIPTNNKNQSIRKIPHIGWNDLKPRENQGDWLGTSLADTKIGEYFYFVHSYMTVVEDSMNILAQCNYDGVLFSAAIRRNNITGLQFHPEKSGESGLKILHRFIN
tara:strand:- start:55 stop:696 length:642 start_codon:yes stop_codon:yes gene_type:complete